MEQYVPLPGSFPFCPLHAPTPGLQASLTVLLPLGQPEIARGTSGGSSHCVPCGVKSELRSGSQARCVLFGLAGQLWHGPRPTCAVRIDSSSGFPVKTRENSDSRQNPRTGAGMNSTEKKTPKQSHVLRKSRLRGHPPGVAPQLSLRPSFTQRKDVQIIDAHCGFFLCLDCSICGHHHARIVCCSYRLLLLLFNRWATCCPSLVDISLSIRFPCPIEHNRRRRLTD